MSKHIAAQATDVAAVLEWFIAARTRCTLEDIVGLLNLEPTLRRGAAGELVDDRLYVDNHVSRHEQARQWALGIARFLIREGAQCPDEVALANALLSRFDHRAEPLGLARTAG